MLDIKQIRKNPEKVEELIKRKEPSATLSSVITLDEKNRALISEVEKLKTERNVKSKQVGILKKNGEDANVIMEEVRSIAEKISHLDAESKKTREEMLQTLAALPNTPFEEIPVSSNPEDNVCIKTFGEKRKFDFEFKNHLELNESLRLYDFERGAKITGSGWPMYKGVGAQLEWALIQFMMQHQISNGFTPWLPPFVVKRETIFASGQLPKFEEQQFKIHDEHFDFFMIPTAEVPLNSIHRDEILDESSLPLKYCSYTPCFRREAGAAGSQERGLIRIHQFNKVEMFAFTTPEQSGQVFKEMLLSAEGILESLGLHYRNMLLVTGDTSFASAHTVDIEVYLPGQNRYYEVSSISNCTDYQARRSKIRAKKGKNKPEFVHTLNGSGLATPRLTVAILENNQQKDGSVCIPKVLQPYLGGLELIEPNTTCV